jgi:ubiquinone/menaquinone biosynthesis C-methylase UbiE
MTDVLAIDFFKWPGGPEQRTCRPMNLMRVPPAWRLPEGVDGPLWEYTHTSRLAAEEDAYFADHPLFHADDRALGARFVEPGRLVDLGCGAGRHALAFAARGFSVTAVDLSRPMLEMVDSKARERALELTTVQSNLCRLACFPDQVFDYALSMFSTLGMIRGRDSRRRALAEARRILRPGGRIALHVHNFWLNLRDPQGRRWLWTQVWPAILDRSNLGDRRMNYRGIPGMKVHLYRWGELKRELAGAGFTIREVLPLGEVSASAIDSPWLIHRFRAGGWLVFAVRR